jgi:hypothetical protein
MSGGAGSRLVNEDLRVNWSLAASRPLARVLDRLIFVCDTEAQLDSALERDLILLRRDSVDAA